MTSAMATKNAIKRGKQMAAWARGFYKPADLAAWAAEQGAKSDAAAACGADADAAMYAAAYMHAV